MCYDPFEYWQYYSLYSILSKFRKKILKSLTSLLNLDMKFINLKGKTVEKLGLIGKEKAIACEVIASISQYE